MGLARGLLLLVLVEMAGVVGSLARHMVFVRATRGGAGCLRGSGKSHERGSP